MGAFGSALGQGQTGLVDLRVDSSDELLRLAVQGRCWGWRSRTSKANAPGGEEHRERDEEDKRERGRLQRAVENAGQEVEVGGVVDEVRELRDQQGSRDGSHQTH